MIIDCWKLEQSKWAECWELMQTLEAEETSVLDAIVSEPWLLIALSTLIGSVLGYLIAVMTQGRNSGSSND